MALRGHLAELLPLRAPRAQEVQGLEPLRLRVRVVQAQVLRPALLQEVLLLQVLRARVVRLQRAQVRVPVAVVGEVEPSR
jgi:hypothetical protein